MRVHRAGASAPHHLQIDLVALPKAVSEDLVREVHVPVRWETTPVIERKLVTNIAA
jgi:hypothetical protein